MTSNAMETIFGRPIYNILKSYGMHMNKRGKLVRDRKLTREAFFYNPITKQYDIPAEEHPALVRFVNVNEPSLVKAYYEDLKRAITREISQQARARREQRTISSGRAAPNLIDRAIDDRVKQIGENIKTINWNTANLNDYNPRSWMYKNLKNEIIRVSTENERLSDEINNLEQQKAKKQSIIEKKRTTKATLRQRKQVEDESGLADTFIA